MQNRNTLTPEQREELRGLGKKEDVTWKEVTAFVERHRPIPARVGDDDLQGACEPYVYRRDPYYGDGD